MADMGVLEADHVGAEFRQPQPQRHLPLEHATLARGIAGAGTLAGDHQHEFGAVRLSTAQESQQRRVRFALRAAVQVEAREVRHTHRSYVFFRITGLSNEGEPSGAQGVPLIPLRSIAVDKIHVYGTPFYIDASLPIASAKPTTPFRRLMIAQDTGSAIIGPARADLYWGAGNDAGRVAGRIRHAGRFVMLLPRELDMVAAGRQMPLPLKKPPIPEDEVKTEPEAAKAEPEAKTEDANKNKTEDANKNKTEDANKKAQTGKPEPEAKTPPKRTRQQAGQRSGS